MPERVHLDQHLAAAPGRGGGLDDPDTGGTVERDDLDRTHGALLATYDGGGSEYAHPARGAGTGTAGSVGSAEAEPSPRRSPGNSRSPGEGVSEWRAS